MTDDDIRVLKQRVCEKLAVEPIKEQWIAQKPKNSVDTIILEPSTTSKEEAQARLDKAIEKFEGVNNIWRNRILIRRKIYPINLLAVLKDRLIEKGVSFTGGYDAFSKEWYLWIDPCSCLEATETKNCWADTELLALCLAVDAAFDKKGGKE